MNFAEYVTLGILIGALLVSMLLGFLRREL